VSNFFIEKLYKQYKNVNDKASPFPPHPEREPDQTIIIDNRGYLLYIQDPVIGLGRNVFDLMDAENYRKFKIALLTANLKAVTVVFVEYQIGGVLRSGEFHIIKIDGGERIFCYIWRGPIITYDFNCLKEEREEKELALL